MPRFQVTLNFSFDRHYSDDETEYESNQTSRRKQKAAFQRTDKFYEDHDLIAYIKSNDAMEMVEYLPCDAEVLSAKWDEEAFAIHLVVHTELDVPDLIEDFQTTSLEDGEYESCGETGWILFTRDEEGKSYQGGAGSDDVWEYGLVDYRQNNITVVPMPPA